MEEGKKKRGFKEKRVEEKMELELLQMGRGRITGGRERKEDKNKRIRMCCVHV